MTESSQKQVLDQVAQILAPFPADHPIHDKVTGLFSADHSTRFDASHGIYEFEAAEWTEAQALAVLKLGTSGLLPHDEEAYNTPSADYLTTLWDAPHDSLIEPSVEAYPAQPDAIKRPLLIIMLTRHSRAGARAFADTIAQHGWPDRLYQRFDRELDLNLEFADELFPKLLEHAGDHFMTLSHVMLAGVATGRLEPSAVEPALPRLRELLDETLKVVAKKKPSKGTGWMFAYPYAETRRRAGLLLDLFGRLDDPDSMPLIEGFLDVADPWPRVFAALALLRSGHAVEKEAIEELAAAPETRPILWNGLASLDHQALFPEEFATLEAFAEADIVNWLKYPTELGKLPAMVELMDRYVVDGEVLFIWRFKETKSKAWKAASSGPYPPDSEGPVSGPCTFSSFENWSSKTSREHAESIMEILASWQ